MVAAARVHSRWTRPGRSVGRGHHEDIGVRDGVGGVVRAVPVVGEDEEQIPRGRAHHDVARGVDAKLVAAQGLAPVDVPREIPRAVFDADDERRRGPRDSAVGRLDDEVLVVELLASLPDRFVLLVLEGDEYGAVRLHRWNGELVLIALAGGAGPLEGTERRVRPRNLLRRRPVVAAVITECAPDRGRGVSAEMRFELRPGQIRPAVKA